MKNSYFLLLGLYLAANTIRNFYEILKKRGILDPKNKLLFAVIFADMVLLWISWFAMCPLDPVPLTLPSAIKGIGLAAAILGLVLAVGSLIQLRGLENISRLVSTGFYARLRHPMYTGFILWIIGWGTYHGAAVSLGAGLVGIANIQFWCRLEDEALETLYGEDYRSYRKRTWF